MSNAMNYLFGLVVQSGNKLLQANNFKKITPNFPNYF